MENVETQPESKPTNTFNADAPETSVPLSLERNNKLFNVTHFFKSASDEDLIEYQRRRNVRMRDATKAELGEKGVAVQTESEAAAVWLWNKLASRVEGYKPSDEWREKISADDKVFAIEEGLLACEAIAPDPVNADEDELADFDSDGAATNRIQLKFRSNGNDFNFYHDMREASSADLKDFKELMRTSYQVRGEKLGQGAIRVPSKAKPMGKLYDRLLIESDPGYATRVPLHHKLAVILAHLSKEQEAVTKN